MNTLDFSACDGRSTTPITVLSHGAGQDSMAMLAKCVFSASFRDKYVKGDLVCVHADTGDEHPDSYAYINEVLIPFCRAWQIPFFYLTSDLGYHSPSWLNLRAQYRRNTTIGMMTTRSCTDNLKIAVIYKFLEEYLGRRYGFKWGRKAALKAYKRRFGKLPVMIGFAKGEEHRIKEAPEQLHLALPGTGKKKDERDKWMRVCVKRFYPLIHEGIDRAGAQAYIASCGLLVPPPSNCIACHYKSPVEIAWTALTLPDSFEDWCQLEEAKLEKYRDRVDADGKPAPNNTVKGTDTLRVIAARTIRELKGRFGTDERLLAYLNDYRQSHGHCVRNAM